MTYFPNLLDHGLWAIYLLLAGSCGLGLALGGKPERYGVGALIFMFAVQIALLAFTGDEQYESLDWASLATDLTGFVLFMALALNANRTWPIVAAALQLLAVLGHLLQGTSELVAFAYITFKTWPTMLIAYVLLPVGAIRHARRLRIRGSDRDWFPYKRYAEFRGIARDANL